MFGRIPGRVVVEKPLVIRLIDNRKYYWNYADQRWKRLTKRCPLL